MTKMKEAKQKPSELHPVFLLGDRIEREGVVIINNITSQPLGGETYISPYAMVALCLQGTAQSDYDTIPVEFHAHDMTLLRKGHVLRAKESSADYHARFIVISDAFFEKFKHLNIQRYNSHSPYYIQHPSCHLTDEQFQQASRAFDLLESVSTADIHYREELILNVLNIIFMLHYEFNPYSRGLPPRGHQSATGAALQGSHYRALPPVARSKFLCPFV